MKNIRNTARGQTKKIEKERKLKNGKHVFNTEDYCK